MNSAQAATLALRAAGWAFEGEKPAASKYVCLAVPHTSNWDGLLLLLVAQAIDLPMAWMIKDDWVRGPIGQALRKLGAVAVNRRSANDLVGQMVAEFAARDRFVLVIPPEGTRGRTEHWRSGFYHIAVGAQVPVVCGYLDYARKRAGLGAPIAMTGDVRTDMDAIRAFYAARAPGARRPADHGPIRLRAEDEPSR